MQTVAEIKEIIRKLTPEERGEIAQLIDKRLGETGNCLGGDVARVEFPKEEE